MQSLRKRQTASICFYLFFSVRDWWFVLISNKHPQSSYKSRCILGLYSAGSLIAFSLRQNSNIEQQLEKHNFKMRHPKQNLYSQKSLYAAAVALLISVGCSNGRSGLSIPLQNGTATSSSLSSSTAGQLPTQLPVNSVLPKPEAVSTPGSTSPTPTQSNLSPATVSQIAYDFGEMNYCYQSTLRRGQQLLTQGSAPSSIFQQAGEQLVQCYNQILNYRAQQLQAYQQQQRIYQQNMAYLQQLAQRLYQQQTQQSGQGQITRPPSR
ncbi:MAG: hypothetical protein EBQ85_03230 [Proteobacteria bacterium]|nr:hypothetical protein [Pseudomonadota bacterium]